jgi:RecB family exonuclease
VPIPRTVEIHHDFEVLEARLEELIREAQAAPSPDDPSASPLPAVLVVAPTQRLLAHLQVVLAARLPALVNVRFLHHDALARAVADHAGLIRSRTLGAAATDALVEKVALDHGGAVAEFARSRPGSVAALARTIDDLREAGIDPEGAPRTPGLSLEGRETLRLYASCCKTLERLALQGFRDRAGFCAAAAPHAGDYARQFRCVLHYGAYELIGVNVDLMRALEASGRPVIYLAPGHPASPAFEYGRRFWSSIMEAAPRPCAASPAVHRLLADRLTDLYAEAAPGDPLPAVELFHAQGAQAELREVALRILRHRRDRGTPLSQIAVVARTLDPYAAHLEAIFGEHGLPFVTTAALSAMRQPRAQAALWLLRCLLDDHPSGALFDLLRGGLLRIDAATLAGARACEPISRDLRATGGFAFWTRRLPEWVAAAPPFLREEADEAERQAARSEQEERIAASRHLAVLVTGLQAEAARLARVRDWSGWTEAVLDILSRRIDGFAGDVAGSDPGARAVLAALDEIGALDAAAIPFVTGAALPVMERTLAAARLPIGSIAADGRAVEGDPGGVRILDAPQARGLSFEVLFAIGLNADLFPRQAQEDPFLPDPDRRRLRETSRRPIGVSAESREEEHLMLALLLGAARRHLTVSWQRADQEGKARSPSLALRELARVAFGTGDLGGIEERAERIPAHPTEQGCSAVRRHGLLSTADAGVTLALLARSPAAMLARLDEAGAGGLSGDPAILKPGLAFLEAIEAGPGAAHPFDAMPGLPVDPHAYGSPSRLEALGACPQNFFFRHLLHVDEWGDPTEEHDVESRELGVAAHAVLRDVYATLIEEGRLARGPTAPAIDRAVGLLPAAWARRTGSIAARLRPLYSGLFDLIGAQWIAALERFLERDLRDLEERGLSVDQVEEAVRVELPLVAGAPPLVLRGRFDRVSTHADGGLLIADYKTSGKLAEHVDPAQALKGSRIQMMLYALMAERTGRGPAGHPVEAEVIGVGPLFAAERPGARNATRALLQPRKLAEAREGFLETLQVLRRLADAGLHPLNAKSRVCSYCPYQRACRREHAPSLERLAADPALRDYHLMLRKNTRRPTLSAVPEGVEGEEEE